MLMNTTSARSRVFPKIHSSYVVFLKPVIQRRHRDQQHHRVMQYCAPERQSEQRIGDPEHKLKHNQSQHVFADCVCSLLAKPCQFEVGFFPRKETLHEEIEIY